MKRDRDLWIALLAGPLVWAAAFLAKFFLAYWLCVYGWKPAAYLISGLAFVVTAVAGWLGWVQWQHASREATLSRAGMMAVVALLLNAFFLVVLVAGSLPEWLMGGCE